MPLDYDECEKLHEELNRLFDQRIKDRIEECVQRFLPMVGNNFIKYTDLPKYISSLKRRAKAA